jgi:hypothetical protein
MVKENRANLGPMCGRKTRCRIAWRREAQLAIRYNVYQMLADSPRKRVVTMRALREDD